jgi:hypothetical protein
MKEDCWNAETATNIDAAMHMHTGNSSSFLVIKAVYAQK